MKFACCMVALLYLATTVARCATWHIAGHHIAGHRAAGH